MAVVIRFFRNPNERSARHDTDVECGWSIVESSSGRLIQLDTFGSKDRKFVGKKSQTIQLDRAAAEQLMAIIRQTFT